MSLLTFPGFPATSFPSLPLNLHPHCVKHFDKTVKPMLPYQPMVQRIYKNSKYFRKQVFWQTAIPRKKHIPLNLLIPCGHHLQSLLLWQIVRQFHFLKVQVKMESVLPWWPSHDTAQVLLDLKRGTKWQRFRILLFTTKTRKKNSQYLIWNSPY